MKLHDSYFFPIMGCSNGSPILRDEDLNYISHHTALDRAQVDEYHSNFLAKHPEGQISRKYFKCMILGCYPDTKHVDKLEKHIFRMYDTNGDGLIDFHEFMIILYVLSSGTPEENLNQIFKIFDINRDGSISLREMKRVIKDLYTLFLTKEHSKVDAQKGLAKNIFEEMDTDLDGRVSQEEFITAVLAQEKFSTYLTLKIIDIFVTE
ncbi:neurocalcin-delta A isoform X2 [Lepeophtheirus salmonis]|uniref:neurocalcin-delta A isoform X2 n=1 Tax=Lepeophtheirus salmonis TaxID=72036 RepID=UPI001AEA1A32|nr:neuronal calcium sensor 2-like isoform X2 [Lepeophtheirus salmonis]